MSSPPEHARFCPRRRSRRPQSFRIPVLVAGLALLGGCASEPAEPERNTDFRIYRANPQLQQDRIPTLGEDEPGCQNMLLGLTVYRVAQIGFKHCTVYSEKDCRAGTEIPVSWQEEREPVKQFTQGARWYLVSEDPQGHTMASWHCQAMQ